MGLKAKGLHGNRTEEKAVVKTTQLTPPTANQSGQHSQADDRLTSMQYVKSAWSQLTHRGDHRFNADQEEVHDVETELEQIGESDEDALLSTETRSHTSSFRSRLTKMLRQLRSGFTKSLKDLKLFMRWAL